jgi:hypothetical protein
MGPAVARLANLGKELAVERRDLFGHHARHLGMDRLQPLGHAERHVGRH